MTISYGLENTLRSGIFSEEGERWYNHAQIAPNYQNNTVFSRFLEVVLPYDGECFIPVLGLSNTLSYIQQWFDTVHPTQPVKLSYPLYVGGSETRKTADSIIQSINRCPSHLRLANIKTSKGLDYYGGQGLIFDEHWNPLMLCGFIINIDRINRHITVVRPVCYVSPVVFGSNDLLSKAIVKKVIPYISMQGVSVPSILRSSSYLTFDSTRFRNVPVTIEFINDYFISPASPIVIEGLDDSIWDFLSENVNDLI